MKEIIRMSTVGDISKLYEHMDRETSESGRNGDLIFFPFEQSMKEIHSFETFQKSLQQNLVKDVSELGWERNWIVTDEEKIYGHLKLKHMLGIKSSLHRILLSMGIERSHRNRGFGTQLMQVALDWAAQQRSLDYVNLNVFSHNEPAIYLYKKFGFEQIGKNDDLFRVHGQRINDIMMSLKL